MPLLFAAVRPPREQAWRPYYVAIAADGVVHSQQLVLAVVLLPDQALLATDAIVRTVVRVSWHATHACSSGRPRRTLKQTTGNSRLSVWRRMWPAVLFGGGDYVVRRVARASVATTRDRCGGLSAMAWTALALAWLLVPEPAIALSAPLHAPESDPRSPTSARPRCAMRASLAYFDRFVTAETHWLVPGQLPGDAGAGHRGAHVADEHRSATAGDGVGMRSGISHAR